MRERLRKAVARIFGARREFSPSETFILEGQIAAIAKETPPTISGTVYFSRDFVTEESMARLRQRELDEYGYISRSALLYGTWRGHEDTYVSSVLEEIETDPEFPQDIILAVYNNEPAHYFRAFSLVRGLIVESGFLSHGMILTREHFQVLEDKMKNVVVLSNVDLTPLESGDKVMIDLQDNDKAKITVSRQLVTKENSSS